MQGSLDHCGTDSELVKSLMTPRQILSPQARVALFDPPTDLRAIVYHQRNNGDLERSEGALVYVIIRQQSNSTLIGE